MIGEWRIQHRDERKIYVLLHCLPSTLVVDSHNRTEKIYYKAFELDLLGYGFCFSRMFQSVPVPFSLCLSFSFFPSVFSSLMNCSCSIYYCSYLWMNHTFTFISKVNTQFESFQCCDKNEKLIGSLCALPLKIDIFFSLFPFVSVFLALNVFYLSFASFWICFSPSRFFRLVSSLTKGRCWLIDPHTGTVLPVCASTCDRLLIKLNIQHCIPKRRSVCRFFFSISLVGQLSVSRNFFSSRLIRLLGRHPNSLKLRWKFGEPHINCAEVMRTKK